MAHHNGNDNDQKYLDAANILLDIINHNHPDAILTEWIEPTIDEAIRRKQEDDDFTYEQLLLRRLLRPPYALDYIQALRTLGVPDYKLLRHMNDYAVNFDIWGPFDFPDLPVSFRGQGRIVRNPGERPSFIFFASAPQGASPQTPPFIATPPRFIATPPRAFATPLELRRQRRALSGTPPDDPFALFRHNIGRPIDSSPVSPPRVPQPLGTAFVVHNAFDNVDKDATIKFFDTKDLFFYPLTNEEAVQFVHNNLKDIINLVSDDKETDLQKLDSINLVSDEMIDLMEDVKFKQLGGLAVQYAQKLPKALQKEYIDLYLTDTCEAYGTKGKYGMSCVKGRWERVLLSIGSAIIKYCSDEKKECPPEYDKFLILIGMRPKPGVVTKQQVEQAMHDWLKSINEDVQARDTYIELSPTGRKEKFIRDILQNPEFAGHKDLVEKIADELFSVIFDVEYEQGDALVGGRSKQKRRTHKQNKKHKHKQNKKRVTRKKGLKRRATTRKFKRAVL